MKKILLLLSIFAMNPSVHSQCETSVYPEDSTICLGDTVNLTAYGPSTDLTTTFSAGNNHRGNMFDIVAVNTVTIESFDAHPMGNTTIEIYYKVGGFAGSESNPGAWTLVGSAAVVAQPTGTPTPVPVSIGVTIPAGQTYSFYVTSSNTAVSINYSDGTTPGAVYASDGNIQFLEGVGLEYPFTAGGGTFSPRIWNGNIHYSTAGTTTFSWSNGASTNTIDVSPSVGTTYYVDITPFGCPTVTDSVTINVSNLSIDLGPDLTICEDSTVTLDAGNTGATYSWNSGLENTQTIVASGTNQYDVLVTNADGCEASDTITITSQAAPVIDLGLDTLICVNGIADFNAGTGFSSYIWSNSENTASITVDGATVGVGNYTYSVIVTDGIGCVGTDTVNLIVDGCAGVESLESTNFLLYPNPTNGKVLLSTNQHFSNVAVKIIGMDGTLHYSNYFNNQFQEIDMDKLSEGIYLLEIQADDTFEVIRIIKN